MGRAIQVSGGSWAAWGVAAILLMAGPGLFVANAADELPKESVLPVSLAGRPRRPRWISVRRTGIGSVPRWWIVPVSCALCCERRGRSAHGRQ